MRYQCEDFLVPYPSPPTILLFRHQRHKDKKSFKKYRSSSQKSSWTAVTDIQYKQGSAPQHSPSFCQLTDAKPYMDS